ncbi:MAG: helix-turn-helix domain-containing protein [Brevundimonas sp.]|uniref:helix-turn-helix domain-containing protein n=1 Tax=Brevundimonas sp. TaxID=1871086 RepID=UPI00391AFC2C
MADDAIAERLRSVRETYRLTQAEMAAELGVQLPTYKRWEQAKNDIPAAAFFALERSRNINPSWLYSGNGPVHGPRQPAKPIDDDQAESIVFKVYRRWSDRLNIAADDLDVVVEFGKEIARRTADRAAANASATQK